MSHSTTSGGTRVCRRLRAMLRISPPWRRLWRMVRRRSVTGPSGSGRRRRVLRRSSGRVRRRISCFAAAISSALIASKSMRCRRSWSDTVSTASCTGGSSCGCVAAVALLLHRLGDAAGGRRRAFQLLLLLRLQQRHRRGLFGGGGVAPEQCKRLVEHFLVLVPVGHHRAQRRAGFRLVAEFDQRQRLLRGEGLGRPDRQPGTAQQAGEVHDVGGECGGGKRGGGGEGGVRSWPDTATLAASRKGRRRWR